MLVAQRRVEGAAELVVIAGLGLGPLLELGERQVLVARHQPHQAVDRGREVEVLALAHLQRRDPHHPSRGVEHRAPRRAGRDRGADLDQALPFVVPDPAHQPVAHRVRQALGARDRRDPIADPEARGSAQRERMESRGTLEAARAHAPELEHDQVAVHAERVDALHVVEPAIAERRLGAVGVLEHVEVGGGEAGAGDHEPAALRQLAILVIVGHERDHARDLARDRGREVPRAIACQQRHHRREAEGQRQAAEHDGPPGPAPGRRGGGVRRHAAAGAAARAGHGVGVNRGATAGADVVAHGNPRSARPRSARQFCEGPQGTRNGYVTPRAASRFPRLAAPRAGRPQRQQGAEHACHLGMARARDQVEQTQGPQRQRLGPVGGPIRPQRSAVTTTLS